MTEEKNTEASQPSERHRLRELLLTASAWTFGGNILGQGLRFGSNLLLARILFPEAFGLMAIVNSFIVCLAMLSDVGISQNVVQNRRGEETAFLNTAWTAQVIRGVALWAVASLLSWPVSQFYGEPELIGLVIVASFSSVLAGLTSTSVHLWNRRLQQDRLTILELTSRVASILSMIVLALYWHSVMALAVGGIVGAAVRMIGSHLWSDSPRNRLAWDHSAAQSMARFGRWIFLGSMLGYLVNQGDRVILGLMLSMAELGRYSIAALLSQTVVEVNNLLADRVLFPLFSRFGKTTDATLVERVRKVRLALMAAFLPPLCLLVIGGDLLVDFLYDDRYEEAGWMVRVLAAGTIFTIVGQIGPIFLARGESMIGLIAIGIRSVFLISLMLVGWKLGGSSGVIVAVALSHFVNYPLQVWISRRYDLWLPRLDLMGLGLSAAAIASGLYLRGLGLVG